MNEKTNIRTYRKADQSKLIEILQLNVPEYFDKSEIQDFEFYLAHEIEMYFVIERDGEIAGSGGINFERDQKVGKLSWDFVHPNHHGTGLGSKLLRHRMELLRSMDVVEEISVRTSQFAYKFYEKNGFDLKHVHPDFWAKGIDMYFMNFKLTR